MDDVVGLRQQVVRQRQVGQEDGGRRALGPRDTRIAFYDILDLGFRYNPIFNSKMNSYCLFWKV